MKFTDTQLDQAALKASQSILEATKEDVAKIVRAELKKMGVDSPADLSVKDRKEFFNKIDAMVKSKAEKAGRDPDDLRKESIEEEINDIFEKIGVIKKPDAGEVIKLANERAKEEGFKSIFDVPDKKRREIFNKIAKKHDLKSLKMKEGKRLDESKIPTTKNITSKSFIKKMNKDISKVNPFRINNWVTDTSIFIKVGDSRKMTDKGFSVLHGIITGYLDITLGLGLNLATQIMKKISDDDLIKIGNEIMKLNNFKQDIIK